MHECMCIIFCIRTKRVHVLVTECSDPALEGDSVTFGCPYGLIMVGPNIPTCTENGQWNPDPTTVTAKVQ